MIGATNLEKHVEAQGPECLDHLPFRVEHLRLKKKTIDFITRWYKVTHLLFPSNLSKRFSVTIPKKVTKEIARQDFFHKGFPVSKWHCPKDLLIEVFSKIFSIPCTGCGLSLWCWLFKVLKRDENCQHFDGCFLFSNVKKRFFLEESQDFNSLKMTMRRPKSNEKWVVTLKKTFYEVGFPFLTEIFVEDEYQQLRDGFHGTHLSKVGTHFHGTLLEKVDTVSLPTSYFLLIVFFLLLISYFWGGWGTCAKLFFLLLTQVYLKRFIPPLVQDFLVSNVRI